MKSHGIIRFVLLCLMPISLYSCIYDDYAGREQYALTVEYVDSMDNRLPDSVAFLDRIECFADGIYKGALTKDEDGKFRYVANEGENITFVSIAGANPNEYSINLPSPGESIHNCWLQMNLKAEESAPEPSAVYYGSVQSKLQRTRNENVIIRMHDVRGRIRIIARNLFSNFGNGNYTTRLDNCLTGIAYDGSSSGETSSYEMPGTKNSNGDYETISRTIFPTGDLPLRVKIFNQDGTLLFERDKDDNGNPIHIHSGEINVIMIKFNNSSDAIIKVVPYEDIENSTIFP